LAGVHPRDKLRISPGEGLALRCALRDTRRTAVATAKSGEADPSLAYLIRASGNVE